MGVLSAFIGPICLLCGLFLALYIKDKAREVAKQEATEAIKLTIEIFKNELSSKLDAIYQRVPELKLMFETRDTRIEVIEDKLDMQSDAIVDLEKGQADMLASLNRINTTLERFKSDGKTSST
jgi:archaellum component FlaC